MLAAESLPTPRRGIGNPTAEEHVEAVDIRLRGEGRRRIRLRQVAQDAPHLAGARIEQDGHGKVGITVQRNRATGAGECDARQVPGPAGLDRESEGEGGTPVTIGGLGHGEVEGEELVTVGRPSGDPVFTGGIGEHGRSVDHEGGVQIEFAVGVCTAPQEEGL